MTDFRLSVFTVTEGDSVMETHFDMTDCWLLAMTIVRLTSDCWYLIVTMGISVMETCFHMTEFRLSVKHTQSVDI